MCNLQLNVYSNKNSTIIVYKHKTDFVRYIKYENEKSISFDLRYDKGKILKNFDMNSNILEFNEPNELYLISSIKSEEKLRNINRLMKNKIPELFV